MLSIAKLPSELSFMKGIHVVSENMTGNDRKTAICHSQILRNTLYFKNRCIILSNAHLLYYLAPI